MACSTLPEFVAARATQSNPLATITQDCIVIRDSTKHSHTIIGVSCLSGIKRISITHPCLLVFASALFVIAAAALYSKEGDGAGTPACLLGLAFALGYWLSRKAAVAFLTGSAATETSTGSPSEAAALISTVESARRRLQEP
jgi:hypothetical protein